MSRPAQPHIREALLDAARALFLSNGYAATGTEEICRIAGVTKGALFHLFGSKEGLANGVLERWIEAGGNAYRSASFVAIDDAGERALAFVDFTIAITRSAPVGCLIGTLAQEISNTHQGLRGRCDDALRDWGAGLTMILDDAQRMAAPARRFDSASMGRHFVAVFEGAQILAKLRGSTDVVVEHLTHFRAYLERVLIEAGAIKRPPQKPRKGSSK